MQARWKTWWHLGGLARSRASESRQIGHRFVRRCWIDVDERGLGFGNFGLVDEFDEMSKTRGLPLGLVPDAPGEND